MNIVTLLPFIVLIGAMFLMTRSAKNKQRQAQQMREEMQPGTGVRTIGGMYATVKEVHDDTVLLEVAPGVHAIYAKNAVGAVLPDAEYNRIVHGIDPDEDATDTPVVPDDASSLTEAADAGGDAPADKTGAADEADEKADVKKIDLGKDDAPAADAAGDDKRDGGTDAK
ncbi:MULTISPECIES: preprotein translocase subunit YajC [Streptomyces]|uniref:Preprotein translocase subunit YajC n=2 Tax=Streptomyces TaxID=1883 RepID=A0ABT9L1V6_9ACTN|nr:MULTISPECIES: preprotein translocase subunit YajC [Streptomyces]MBW8091075.1 preprotein translocase subunit YajC [Streptomyces hygroscopicus subsp. hygroscopicus]MCO8304762.1 preprotein translocase subunit YajC [Streptomyces sp. RKCA744]MDN3054191.1 preprotein translocase subunit YajC [Streptomyces sp. SRF1]MDP9614687.1 preprotein translocase subunit YajC [Streptomyces demainii]GHJ32579.1 preprotein translocase subunit YajC [Streptomyces hygroscopicus]